MKHLTKKLSTLFIVAVLAVTMLLPATANAAEQNLKYSANLTLTTEGSYNIIFPEKIKKATSSNPKVFNLINYEDGYADDFENPKAFVINNLRKPGQTIVTFTGKSGKVYTMNLTVVKYKNPVKKFKIGSKNVASQFKKKNFGWHSIKRTQKQKISIKAKKGWKIVEMDYSDYNLNKPVKKIKNNKYVTLKYYSSSRNDMSASTIIHVKLKNKVTGAFSIISLTL